MTDFFPGQGIQQNVVMLEEFLKVTYKDNFAFQVLNFPPGATFRIHVKCINSLTNKPTVTVQNINYSRYESTLSDLFEAEKVVPFVVQHNTPMSDFPFHGPIDCERWVLDRIMDVEMHEAMEFFKVKGKAVYFPDHEPGGRPYQIKRRDDAETL